MRVTVCQLNHRPEIFSQEFEHLKSHVIAEKSELVLLPEMPFGIWQPNTKNYALEEWNKSVQDQQEWIKRLSEFAPAFVLGTLPVNRGDKRINEAFIVKPSGEYVGAHEKYYLPDCKGVWEASWYHRGDGRFELHNAGQARLGFQICTEMWFSERGRAYGKMGANLVVTPRKTEAASLDKWLAGGRTLAVVAGAFAISSNSVTTAGDTADFAGGSWIIDPNGNVLGITNAESPFLTLDLDFSQADVAKSTYPRYVEE